ncbi:putative IQ motif, EF-hand binding, Dilute domain-containing protein [Lupinus albus]|uniref:Putative IQ motif, EF-hand binding, Dilute domain-containing protein n=1 Tax=Lupinus albus TaxID=3870 RepID=A0A6A4NWU6_LUPAL|nr:putative IQ motif, EF-hand binding, Dilute domain-containing protein [Lupinus albus]
MILEFEIASRCCSHFSFYSPPPCMLHSCSGGSKILKYSLGLGMITILCLCQVFNKHKLIIMPSVLVAMVFTVTVGDCRLAIGKTKVFLRAGQMAELDTHRSEILGKSASIIQRNVRSYLAYRSFISVRLSAIQIQAACRGQLARQVYEVMRKEASSLMIQACLRMHIVRKTYKELYTSASSIQTSMRGMAARCELRFRRRTRAAIVIQSRWRKYLALLHFTRLKKAAITMQCAWRGKVARLELRKLKMAARETGALQASKTKLEKQVVDLTLRLQLEKRLRVDMEEARILENKRLQSALQETKILLEKEREATKKAEERVTVIKEIPVVDHALLEKLSSENEKLKNMLSSLEKKIDETEKKYEEANKIGEERLKQALEAESKVFQLKTAMQRLEEKFSDTESAYHILQKQSQLNSSVKTIAEHLPTPVAEKLENGHHVKEEQKFIETHVAPVEQFGTESDTKLRRSFVERRQHENVDSLVNCVRKNIGFNHGKPIAAFTIYKCLLHWKSFEADRTSVFDRLIQMIGSEIEDQDGNDLMAYWLSNTSALLFLIEQSLKPCGATAATAARRPPSPTSLLGRMTGFLSPPSANIAAHAFEVVQKVEAKYPAVLFNQQLTAYLEKMYGIIRDNLKKELTSVLASCIQAPRTSKGVSGSVRSLGRDSAIVLWQSIIESLNTLLCTLKVNFVPPVLIQKIFSQTFSYINLQLFNSLLLRRDCCTFSNGEYVKAGLAELEIWCCQAKEEYAGSSWDELKHIRQAVGFLVIHQKYKVSYDEIINDLCPILSVQQLYRICSLYWDDNYNTLSVSPDVLLRMKLLMTMDSNSAQSDSFLIDDSSSIIPFSVDDLCKSLQLEDFSDLEPADELLENPAFQFLNES